MPDSIINALVNAGVLGPVLLALGYGYVRLQKRLDEVQDKRTADAQAVVQTVLEIADRQNDTIQALNMSFRESTHAIQELKETVRELKSSGLRR